MQQSQLYPIQRNEKTGEPFLRLPPPHAHIIMTPFRDGDGPVIVTAMNDPRVHRWISGPPYPYLPEHADEWIKGMRAKSEKILQELSDAEGESEPRIVRGCPIHILRVVKEDGTDALIGDLAIGPNVWYKDSPPEDRERFERENKSKATGDPTTVWTLGDWVDPDYHRQGIMTAAIGALLREWAIPRMGVRLIRVTAFKGNIGSVRVFEKNGFIMSKTMEDLEITGKCKGMHVLDWRLE